jgi:hypothetical protein
MTRNEYFVHSGGCDMRFREGVLFDRCPARAWNVKVEEKKQNYGMHLLLQDIHSRHVKNNLFTHECVSRSRELAL